MIEAQGDGVKWMALMVIGIFMSIGGCVSCVTHNQETTEREKEKTKQIELQWKMDSLNSVKQNGYKAGHI